MRGGLGLRNDISLKAVREEFVFTPLALFSGGSSGTWYDPSDMTTLFQDSAGTTPVTASGQPVGLMRDKSGRGNHLLQATALARPTFTIAGGLSFLSFDGGDFMDSAAYPSAVNQPGLTALAFMANSVAAFQHIVDTPSGGRQSIRINGTTGAIDISAGLADAAATAAILANTAYVANARFNGTTSFVRLNKVAGANVNPGANGQASMRLGSFDGTAGNFAGKFYGMIQRDGAPSDAQQSAIETYLGKSAGLTL